MPPFHLATLRHLALALALLVRPPSQAALAESLQIRSPVPWQVVQRVGYVPHEAHPHAVGGPAIGFADLAIELVDPPGAVTEYRVRVHEVAGDAPPLVDRVVAAQRLENGAARLVVRIRAGGWYRVEVEARDGERVDRGAVEPVGVGEVLLVAGQSYATNTNEERLRVSDRHERVAAWNFRDGAWRVAHDPQPAADESDGGSIWPPLGDQLAALLNVPIGLANVAYGGTSSAQWMPGEDLHRRLVDAGRTLGRVRAVLWQQGESDVIGKTPTEKYVENLVAIRQTAVEAWRRESPWREPPWLLAKSTLHPTVYRDPPGEARIRRAIEQLTERPGFAAGPDTDLLDGDRRGPLGSRRHFTGLGQRQAAQLWFHAVWSELQRPRQEHEIAQATIADLRLTEFAWRSPIVHRESSVLLATDPRGLPEARLAFPAAEILEIQAANGAHQFSVADDVELSTDGRTVRFRRTGPLKPLSPTDLFPPIEAPGSYKHRVGHPEQGLLYAPGRGFHDRDVELTYRRRDAAWNGPRIEPAETVLPRTLARLRAGQSLRLAVSGDSISFGWDASRLSDASPHQFPYPTLVAAQLAESFGAEITLANRAISGWSIAQGVADWPNLLSSEPDLVLVAYGMNDVGRRDPAWFAEQARALVEAIRRDRPEAEIVLVAPMLGHAEWVHTPREMFPRYRDELAKLVGPGVALADLTGVWEALLASKHDLDLTGNGLNHPNDFGHRVYAQVILALLGTGATVGQGSR